MSKATEDVEREHIKNNGIRLLYNEHIHQFDVNLFVKGLNSFVFFFICVNVSNLLICCFMPLIGKSDCLITKLLEIAEIDRRVHFINSLQGIVCEASHMYSHGYYFAKKRLDNIEILTSVVLSIVVLSIIVAVLLFVGPLSSVVHGRHLGVDYLFWAIAPGSIFAAVVLQKMVSLLYFQRTINAAAAACKTGLQRMLDSRMSALESLYDTEATGLRMVFDIESITLGGGKSGASITVQLPCIWIGEKIEEEKLKVGTSTMHKALTSIENCEVRFPVSDKSGTTVQDLQRIRENKSLTMYAEVVDDLLQKHGQLQRATRHNLWIVTALAICTAFIFVISCIAFIVSLAVTYATNTLTDAAGIMIVTLPLIVIMITGAMYMSALWILSSALKQRYQQVQQQMQHKIHEYNVEQWTKGHDMEVAMLGLMFWGGKNPAKSSIHRRYPHLNLYKINQGEQQLQQLGSLDTTSSASSDYDTDENNAV